MKKLTAALVAALVAAVAAPLALADDGGGASGSRPKPLLVCASTSFVGRITQVTTDAVTVRPGASETGRALVVRLTDGTVIRQGDAVADASALVAGARAKFLVRACRSGDRKVLTAKLILLPRGTSDTSGDDGKRTEPGTTTAPTTTEPKPDTPAPSTTPVCGQGETDALLVAVSADSITVRTQSSEGVKEWSLTVNGDTLVRKGDQTVSVTVLKPGDKVHLVLLRCPSTGVVKALKIGVLASA
jgi:hypothetical protein